MQYPISIILFSFMMKSSQHSRKSMTNSKLIPESGIRQKEYKASHRSWTGMNIVSVITHFWIIACSEEEIILTALLTYSLHYCKRHCCDIAYNTIIPSFTIYGLSLFIRVYAMSKNFGTFSFISCPVDFLHATYSASVTFCSLSYGLIILQVETNSFESS